MTHPTRDIMHSCKITQRRIIASFLLQSKRIKRKTLSHRHFIKHSLAMDDSQSRPVGATEFSWCRAVPVGTGITSLSLLLSKPPDLQTLQNAIHTLQSSHPILRSKLTTTSSTSFTFTIPSSPYLEIKSFDVSSTSDLLLQTPSEISPFHQLLERELNQHSWSKHEPENPLPTIFATMYALEGDKWVVALRLHTAICDRTSAVALLKELVGLIAEKKGGGEEMGRRDDKVNLAIEDLVPSDKAKKPFWARGVDLLGYSLNALRFANLDFKDVDSARSSAVIRLKMNTQETDRLLAGCKARGIKLCGVLAAAALIAAYSSKLLPDYQWEKYAVVTLVDCRNVLDPPLHSHNLGFYHSGILNTHDVHGEAELWELASRCYMAFKNAVNSNKHLSDMSDLNFLMCKAIDNPGITPSSSMRTSLIAVFEDPVIEDSRDLQIDIGLEDYVGCSSVHGVGPSIAIFDTIRHGGLDCACVYPLPLHSREQMQELIDRMKRIMFDGRL